MHRRDAGRASTVLISISLLVASIAAMASEAAAATSDATLAPVADAYVNSTQPDRNYGRALSLYIDGGPNEAIGYLAFDLTGLAGRTVTGATLRLVTTPGSFAGTRGIVELRDASDAVWSEIGASGVTYQTRPAIGSVVVGVVGGTSSSQVDHLALSPATLQARLGSTLTLSLSTGSSDGAYFWSRESTDPSLRPELVVSTVDGSTTTTTIPSDPPTIHTFEAAVAASSDDAEELSSGYLDTKSSDLELVFENLLQTVGVRFRGVSIPPGATIDAAWIQFTVDEVSTGSASLTVRAQSAGNPPTFSGSQRVTTRPTTVTRVEWAPEPWPTVGAAGDAQRTPDLRPLIQEIVSRGDWASGNALVLIITGSGTRTAESFDGTAAPRLHIDWHDGSGTPTSPPTGSSPVVVAAGDIACRLDRTHRVTASTCQHRATSDVAVAIRPDAVLALGDNQYPGGSLADFRAQYDPTWGRLKAITHPVPGNKEYGTHGASGYFDYFYPNNQAIRQTGYYSFDLGEWHLVALNSECEEVSCAAGSAQERWLRADLAATNAKCVLAYWHDPWFTSGARGPTVELRPLVEALYDYSVDVLLVGHHHFYERFALQNPDGVLDTLGGFREFIVGTGGKSILNLGTGSYPNREVRDTTSFGVLKLTLNPDSYDWEFVPAAGYTFTDSGSNACH